MRAHHPYVRFVSLSTAILALTQAIRLPGQETAASRPLPEPSPAPVRIACIGDSITIGGGKQSYPAQLGRLLGQRYEVRNFGVSGATMLQSGNKPYRSQDAWRKALAYQPQLAIVCLGTNDSKAKNWRFVEDFANDTRALLDQLARLESKPMVFLATPPPAFTSGDGINGKRVAQAVATLRGIAAERGLMRIEWHTALANAKADLPDGVHPNAAGKRAMAESARDAIFGGAHRVPSADQLPNGYRMVGAIELDDPRDLGGFWFSDPKAWRLHGDPRASLELHQKCAYQPKVRSPHSIALLNHATFDSFVLDVEIQQTGRDYGHRDFCLFFGFQDPEHYYYAHVATKGDDHAHKIFAVDGAPRKSIAKFATDGFDWGREAWQHLRLVRDAKTGTIEIYANDMTRPILSATDTRFRTGHIGFGSFDDTGRVASIRVYAKREATPAVTSNPFSKESP